MANTNQNMIVKYDNQLNNFNYGRFTAVEADIFFSLIAKIKDTDGFLMMTFDDLKSLSNYYSRDEKRFVHDVESTFTKYLNLKYKEDNGDIIKITNVFQRLMIARDKKLVVVEVTPGMEEVIFSLSENFTRFELQEFTNIKGSYSKSLYRLLKQYRHTGYFEISIEDFKFKLDVPKSYKITHIDDVILKPAIKELSSYFEDLKVEKGYKKSSSGKGRPSVSKYIFTFEKEERYKDKKKKIKNKVIPYPCPKCGGQLIERKMNGKIALCHADGHLPDAPCKAIFNGYDEVMPKKDCYAADQSESITEERKENKEKLSSIFGKLFGKK